MRSLFGVQTSPTTSPMEIIPQRGEGITKSDPTKFLSSLMDMPILKVMTTITN